MATEISDEDIKTTTKALKSPRTVKELAEILKVTDATARVRITAVGQTTKLDVSSKKTEGKRGAVPKTYRIAA